MKLFFLRHAKSDWGNPSLKDFDRPLNKRGLRDAPLMGKKLHRYFPDNLKVISSPAKRTKETLELFFSEYELKRKALCFKDIPGYGCQNAGSFYAFSSNEYICS